MKYSDLPSVLRTVPHSQELPVPKPPENVTFSDDTSDFDEDQGQQKGDNVDWDPTSFEARCPSSQPHLLTQRDLNDLVRDLKLSKKQDELSGSRIIGGIFSTKSMKCVSFEIAKTNSKNFSLKKTICYFVMMFALL